MDEFDFLNTSKHTNYRTEPKQEMEKYTSYEEKGLDSCGVCKMKYNVGDRIPRILVNCGHTYCTHCLTKYLHNNKVHCPFILCRKLVKHVDNIEQLPLNIEIFGEIVAKSKRIINFLEPDSDESYLRLCKIHFEKQKHFYCSYHDCNFCRECIKSFHKDMKCCIVDICDIRKIFFIFEDIRKRNELLIKARDRINSKKRMKEEFKINNN